MKGFLVSLVGSLGKNVALHLLLLLLLSVLLSNIACGRRGHPLPPEEGRSAVSLAVYDFL